jgi:hypothetical protein
VLRALPGGNPSSPLARIEARRAWKTTFKRRRDDRAMKSPCVADAERHLLLRRLVHAMA